MAVTAALLHEIQDGRRAFLSPADEIQNDETGHKMFRSVPNALGEKGPSPLQKLTAVLRILAYGIPFDVVHEYTGVQEETARKSTYAFCDGLIANYEHIHLGVWTPEAIAKEMAINKDRGFSGMLGSLDCTHWIWKNCPYPYLLAGAVSRQEGEQICNRRGDSRFGHVFLARIRWVSGCCQ